VIHTGTYNLLFIFILAHIARVCEINMKITFQKMKINLHDLCAIFLLTSILCCMDTILFYNDRMQL
jgi:hypothetical protein